MNDKRQFVRSDAFGPHKYTLNNVDSQVLSSNDSNSELDIKKLLGLVYRPDLAVLRTSATEEPNSPYRPELNLINIPELLFKVDQAEKQADRNLNIVEEYNLDHICSSKLRIKLMGLVLQRKDLTPKERRTLQSRCNTAKFREREREKEMERKL